MHSNHQINKLGFWLYQTLERNLVHNVIHDKNKSKHEYKRILRGKREKERKKIESW